MFGASRRGHHKHACRVLVLTLSMTVAAGTAHADVDTTPPVVTVTPSGVLTAVQKVSFNEPVLGVTTDNVALRLEDATTGVASSLRCRNGSSALVACAGGDVRLVEIVPASPLIAGRSYTVVVNPDGVTPVTDLAANPAPATARPFGASVIEEETSAGATYVWRSVSDSRAYGGSYKTERAAGTMALFRFVGTSVTWYTKIGPDQGKATVTIDGVSKGIFNNYRSSVVLPYSRRWSGLSPGSHVLAIVVRGEKGSTTGTGTWVTVDAVRAGTGAYQDASYSFQRVANSGAYGARYARSATGGSRVAFAFYGGGVDWFTITGPSEGKALVYVDGVLSRTYDNYGTATRFRVRRTIAGLAERVHVVTIIVTGTKNAASAGTNVAFDRWVLKASPVIFRKLGAWVDLFDYTSSTTDATIGSRVADMASRGVKTIYLQTGRYNTDAFLYPTQAGQWLAHAHAAGIAVVGWYFPAYSEYLSGDITKAAAVASFVGPGNHRFDGLGIDIEYRAKTSSKTEFFNGISSHLASVRSRVGLVFPVGAITFSPQDMDRWTAGWSGFPWGSVTSYATAVLPMNYWSVSSNRNLCSGGNTNYCAYGFTLQNILRTRSATGLPVHPIGGVANAINTAEVAQYVQAAKDAHAYGGSLYDYNTTQSPFWTPLAQINAL